MVNPIESAYNFFVAVFQHLPTPIQYLSGLAFALIVIVTVVQMVFRG